MKRPIVNIEKSTTEFLKGIAIFLVILGHMGYIYRGGTWGVSLFLILSGYGIFKSFLKNGTKDFLKKRLLKVFLPYLLVTLFVLSYSFLRYRIGRKTIIFSLLGIDFGFLCDPTMWYISFIFVQYLIFYLSTFLFRKLKSENLKHFSIIALCLILSILVNLLNEKFEIWHPGSGIFLYVYSFGFGLLLAKLSEFKINATLKNLLLSLTIFLSALLILFFYNRVEFGYKYFLYANAFPVLLIALNELKPFEFKSKLINFLGEISYDLYLWEGFFVVMRNELFAPLKYQILINLFTLIFCIFFSKIYNKVFIKPITSLIEKKCYNKTTI